MPDNPLAPSEHLVEAISSQLPAVTDEQVRMVLLAMTVVTTGEPVGTIMRSPDGEWPDGQFAMAVRVSAGGIMQWQITNPDGGTYVDRTPTLAGWVYISRPSEGATAP